MRGAKKLYVYIEWAYPSVKRSNQMKIIELHTHDRLWLIYAAAADAVYSSLCVCAVGRRAAYLLERFTWWGHKFWASTFHLCVCARATFLLLFIAPKMTINKNIKKLLSTCYIYIETYFTAPLISVCIFNLYVLKRIINQFFSYWF